MATQDPALILASTASRYESPQVAASRALQIQQQQQGLTAGAQNLQIGAQDLQAKQYQNQETATQLAEQQAIMKAVQAENARIASSNAVPPAAGPAGPPAPGLPMVPDGSGLIDRTGASAAPAVAAPSATGIVPPVPASFNWDNVTNAVRGQVRPNTSLGMQAQILQSKQKMADFQKTQGEIQAAQEKLNDDKNDEASQQALLVQKNGYSLPSITVMAQHLAMAGHSDVANQLMQVVAQNPDNAKPIIDAIAAGSTATMQTAQARQLTASTSAQKQAADLPKQQADAQQAVMAATAQRLLAAQTPEEYGALRAGIQDPDVRSLFPAIYDQAAVQRLGLTTEQRQAADQAAAALANTKAYQAGELANRGAQLGLEGQRNRIAAASADPFGILGLNPHPAGGLDTNGQPLTGDAYLKTLPSGMAAQVKAIAEGRQTVVPRGAQQIPLMAAVNQYDPTYTAARAKMRAAFTTGKQGDNIGALNTAVVHLDQLADASDALKNGTFRPGNHAYNYLASAFGQNTVTNFDALKTAVAGEMATALKGNATDQEIHHITETLQSANSPAQLAGVARTNLHVLGAKLNSYDERYHALSPDDTSFSPVLPAARAVFNKNGIRPLAGDAAPKKNPFRQ